MCAKCMSYSLDFLDRFAIVYRSFRLLYDETDRFTIAISLELP